MPTGHISPGARFHPLQVLETLSFLPTPPGVPGMGLGTRQRPNGGWVLAALRDGRMEASDVASGLQYPMGVSASGEMAFTCRTCFLYVKMHVGS